MVHYAQLTRNASFFEEGNRGRRGKCVCIVPCAALEGVAALGRGRCCLQRDGHATLTPAVTLFQALNGDAKWVPCANLFPGSEKMNNVQLKKKCRLILQLTPRVVVHSLRQVFSRLPLQYQAPYYFSC